jgi:hypothetical protein
MAFAARAWTNRELARAQAGTPVAQRA